MKLRFVGGPEAQEATTQGTANMDMKEAGTAAEEEGTADVDKDQSDSDESASESNSDDSIAAKLSTDDELSDGEPNDAEVAEVMNDTEGGGDVEFAQPKPRTKAAVAARRRTHVSAAA